MEKFSIPIPPTRSEDKNMSGSKAACSSSPYREPSEAALIPWTKEERLAFDQYVSHRIHMGGGQSCIDAALVYLQERRKLFGVPQETKEDK